ncbi:YiiD C-terminal domain-containing protein [Saccharospirillum impatiens]|uniref:YiiD C-terminal domain-containing protein n=1 Tax=Saccharospirillum impatiens TaxID=169438 RepID=UPI0004162FA0|nr:YiiD C-terminal domain-containing protein [Saccharospirillum impatiens]
MIRLDQIEPLAKLGIEWVSSDDTVTRFHIPLLGNRNDKGTLFAGSQYAALVIAGWYHTARWAGLQGLPEQVAIKDGQVRYPKAALSDLDVQARFTAPPDRRLSGHWRALVEVSSRDASGDTVAVLSGDYRILVPAEA